jgi:phenylacetate-coenzyme A ligase PaaK-like adenylate-forming protein
VNIKVKLKSGHPKAASQPMTKPWNKGTVIGVTSGSSGQSWALVLTEHGEFETYTNWHDIEQEQE